MGDIANELHRAIEISFREVYSELEKGSPDFKNKSEAAEHTLTRIKMKIRSFGLPGDPQKPWEKMTDLGIANSVTLWSLEKQLEPLFKEKV